MILLSLKDLGLTRGVPLFCNLSMTVAAGDRIGLVAANGRGKSSLLRCLAGLIDPTEGEVTRARGLRLALVDQDVPPALLPLPLHAAALSLLDPETAATEGWRADIALDDLAVPADLRTTALGALSGGWQRVALLARAWVSEPDLLLLDEPTNHLDLGRIGLLQRWLATTARGTPALVASHDRAFLDAVTTRTLFLRPRGSALYDLPYSPARAARDQADAADERQFTNEMKQAQQLRRQAAKLHNIGVNSGSDLLVVKTKQLKARADRLEEAARPAHKDRSAGSIRLASAGSPSRALLAFDDLAVTAPDGRLLFRTGQVWLNRGDRAVILGGNGAGKSRLMDAVARATGTAVAGIRLAPTAVTGVADQRLSGLDRFATALEAITRPFDVGDQRARTLLAGAGLGVDLQLAPLAALSGGQRARLAMLVLRLTAPNLYLLDEPTNHLDIEGQEALEAELAAQDASALLVSHDRSFVRAVGTRFWEIAGRRLVEVDSPEPFFAAALAG